MYADDTILFCEIDCRQNPADTIKQINCELDKFNRWCRTNSLKVNAGKTKCVLFKSTYYKNVNLESTLPPLYLDDTALSFC